jgi:NAD dependent epimerase/dehydratase
MNWAQNRVLVTGAGGFIGSHLAERLVELGAKTRALVHYNALGHWGWLSDSSKKGEIEVLAGDIVDRDSVRRATKDVDIVFHLAALIGIPYSYQAPQSYVRTNIDGTMNVLQAALENSVSLVLHTSTSEVYGSARFIPITEAHPLHGQSPYAASKIGADKMVEAFYSSFDLPAIIVRPFNTFGPRQSTRAVVPTIITQLLRGNVIKLGNLKATRDLNFVGNTVDAYVTAPSCPQAIGQTIHFGSNRDISIGDLAHMIARLMGKNQIIHSESERVRPGKSEVEHLLADSSLARLMFGWEPKVSLEEGLVQTIHWLEKNLHRYPTDQYIV